MGTRQQQSEEGGCWRSREAGAWRDAPREEETEGERRLSIVELSMAGQL